MPAYKVIYFQGKGRAEPIRMLLSLAGQEYEDKRYPNVKSEEWLADKPKIPQGQLPVLEVDGKMIPQTGAILRYLARRHGFYGEGNDENTRADMVRETAEDFIKHLIKWYYAEESEKEKVKTQILTEHLPAFFNLLEKILSENKGGDGFFVGNKVSFADIVVFDLNDQMSDMFSKEAIQKAFKPKLAAFTTRMQTTLKNYLEKRDGKPSK